MRFHGVWRNAEPSRNFLVGAPRRQLNEDLIFSVGDAERGDRSVISFKRLGLVALRQTSPCPNAKDGEGGGDEEKRQFSRIGPNPIFVLHPLEDDRECAKRNSV
jgi:hypothetical protein